MEETGVDIMPPLDSPEMRRASLTAGPCSCQVRTGSDRRPILEHWGRALLLLRAFALILALLLGRGIAAALLRRGFGSGHHTALHGYGSVI